tara:strand:+ start:1139 stop:1492 length:354 start_codon:yes stop_codon:yes gene_type:complete
MDSSHINVGFMPDRGRFGVWCYTSNRIVRDGDADSYLITEEGVELHEPGMFRSPTLDISREQAERLMSQLWAEGIRPNGWGHEGQVDALKAHLEDMRRLALPESAFVAMDEARKRSR